MGCLRVRDAKPTTPYVVLGESPSIIHGTWFDLLTEDSVRKKPYNRSYPKGYVEMLEEQQERLVDALQEMYHRLRRNETWPGTKLAETNGQPLTHDLLQGLGVLGTRPGGDEASEPCEQPFERMQSKLSAISAGFACQTSSISSSPGQSNTSSESLHDDPILAAQPLSNAPFDFPPTTCANPAPYQKEWSYPPTQPSLPYRFTPLTNDFQLFQPEVPGWIFTEAGARMGLDYQMWTSQLLQI